MLSDLVAAQTFQIQLAFLRFVVVTIQAITIDDGRDRRGEWCVNLLCRGALCDNTRDEYCTQTGDLQGLHDTLYPVKLFKPRQE